MDDPTFSGDPLKDIPTLIEWRGNGLSFVELVRYLPYLQGERTLYVRDGNREWTVWVDLSQECIDAIETLRQTGVIVWEPASEFTYLCDGGGIRSTHKSKPVKWMPLVLSRVKPKAQHARRARN